MCCFCCCCGCGSSQICSHYSCCCEMVLFLLLGSFLFGGGGGRRFVLSARERHKENPNLFETLSCHLFNVATSPYMLNPFCYTSPLTNLRPPTRAFLVDNSRSFLVTDSALSSLFFIFNFHYCFCFCFFLLLFLVSFGLFFFSLFIFVDI